MQLVMVELGIRLDGLTVKKIYLLSRAKMSRLVLI